MKIIGDRVQHYMENIIDQDEHGYLKKRRTENAILTKLQAIHKINLGNMARVNWERLQTNITSRLQKVELYNTNFAQRATLIKSIIQSKIRFLSNIFPPKDQKIQLCQNNINGFL